MDEQNCVLSASILAPRGALEKQKTPQNEFLTSKFENSSSKKNKNRINRTFIQKVGG
jgi:hypothetical protein